MMRAMTLKMSRWKVRSRTLKQIISEKTCNYSTLCRPRAFLQRRGYGTYWHGSTHKPDVPGREERSRCSEGRASLQGDRNILVRMLVTTVFDWDCKAFKGLRGITLAQIGTKKKDSH